LVLRQHRDSSNRCRDGTNEEKTNANGVPDSALLLTARLFRGILPGSGDRLQRPNQAASIAARARGNGFHRISAFPYAILMRFAFLRFNLKSIP